NWYVASRKCGQLGGELMVLDDNEDRLLATNFLKSRGYLAKDEWNSSLWVGIDCLGDPRNFRKSKNGEVPYLPWIPGEPNNHHSEEECVSFGYYHQTYGYFDFKWEYKAPYVCQHPKIKESYMCFKKELFLEVLL
ncbi:hypothetical protein KR026_000149, partial [Drosophila bipectinata]